ncbi:hypothetical protein E2320_004936, partial [Naja naja]
MQTYQKTHPRAGFSFQMRVSLVSSGTHNATHTTFPFRCVVVSPTGSTRPAVPKHFMLADTCECIHMKKNQLVTLSFEEKEDALQENY